ncbi:MAG: hypothetical protein II073_03350, partial [Lachnospiraceae bacterium]|nr:hypothetical protein [Lachnospiraceae bacterium]
MEKWGSDWQHLVSAPVLNMLGIAQICKVNWLVQNWWYLGLYVGILLITPILVLISRNKYFSGAIFAVSCIFSYVMPHSIEDEHICKYLPMLILGVLIAKNDDWLFCKKIDRRVSIVASVVLLISIALVETVNIPYYMYEIVVASILLMVLCRLLRRTEKICRITSYVGNLNWFLWLVGAQAFMQLRNKMHGHMVCAELGFLVVIVSTLWIAIIWNYVKSHSSGLKDKIAIKSVKSEWILAVALTGVLYILFIGFCEPQRLMVSDYTIQACLSGMETGSPYPVQQFVNVLLTYPISWLYRIFPGIQWWYVYTQVLLCSSSVIIHFGMIHFAKCNQVSIKKILGWITVFDALFIFYWIEYISFTIVPAVVGCAMIVVMILSYETANKKWRIIGGIVFVLGCLAIICHRKNSGIAVFCYLLLVGLYLLIKDWSSIKKFLLGMVSLAAILCAIYGVTFIDKAIQTRDGGEKFKSFNTERVQFIDFVHDLYTKNT